MPHERITPALLMCVECAGLGQVEVLVEPEKTCKVCGGSGRVIEGGDPEVIKLRAENERLKERIAIFEMKYESSGSIFARGNAVARIKELEEALDEIRVTTNEDGTYKTVLKVLGESE